MIIQRRRAKLGRRFIAGERGALLEFLAQLNVHDHYYGVVSAHLPKTANDSDETCAGELLLPYSLGPTRE